MGLTLAEKILKAHVVDGAFVKGQEIGLRIDQTLTQDATGTMAYIEFEAMGIDQVRTERSVAYVDHNTLQSGFENALENSPLRIISDYHFLLGRVVKENVFSFSGELLIASGTTVTPAVVEKARRYGKLIELTTSSES